MTTADEQPTRPGSGPDLSRRMDRIESRQDSLETKVTDLASIVARVELNQNHATELNKLRFDALDTGINNVKDSLERFMGRINAIVSGEVKLPQAEQYEQQVAENMAWREKTEARLDRHDTFETQGRLLGRIVVILVSSNVIAVVAAIAAILK